MEKNARCKFTPDGDVFLPTIDDEGQGDPGFRLLMKKSSMKILPRTKKKRQSLKEFVQFTKDLDTIRNTNISQRILTTERII